MRAAVVLMAYGSPERLADVPAYYRDIRGGRPIRPELVDDLVGGTDAHVVFTAHSLPERILETGDPYKHQLLQTSQLVAERAAITKWTFSFQSESATGEPWLGPDILDHLEDLHERGVRKV